MTNFFQSTFSRTFCLLVLFCCVLVSSHASAARIKDMTTIEGVRSNHLLGYGLVVGLDGSGDQTQQTFFTAQSVKNMLTKLGVVVPPEINLQLKNVAAVMVQAELPAFSRPGQALDVTVLSIGNAKSLRNGSLIMTPLKGVDGKVYAIAQGNLIVGGFGASGSDGSSVTVNSTAGGRIPGGAIVEQSVPMPLADASYVQFNLHKPDFTTATRVANRINEFLGSPMAFARDGVSVQVHVPMESSAKVALLSELENLDVEPASQAARIIVNSRTGTVVIGSTVKVFPAAVAHGNITVSVSESSEVSQPGAFSNGDTAIVDDSEVVIEQEDNPMFLFEPGVTLNDLVEAINAVGAPPGDLVSILQALSEVGALQAQLVVI